MELFAMSVTGKTAKLTIPPNDPNAKGALKAQGFTDDEMRHVMLSPQPFARPQSLNATAATPKRLALEDFPVPRPGTPNDVMPKNSDDKWISSAWFFPYL